MIQNDLFLRALKGETVERPPRVDDASSRKVSPRFHEAQSKI